MASTQPDSGNCSATATLAQRGGREPDYAARAAALEELAQVVDGPQQGLFARLAELGLRLTNAGSCGIGLRERSSHGEEVVRWAIVCGAYSHYSGTTIPREATACGLCLDTGAPVVVVDESTAEDKGSDTAPRLIDQLAIPLSPGAVVWLAMYGTQRRFECEDLRTMSSLAELAGRALELQRRCQRAEDRLRDSEHRLYAMYELAPVGITQTGPDGRLLRVNRAYCEITGYSREELSGLTFQQITHPDDLAENDRLYRLLQTGEISTLQLQKRFIRKDGGVVWAEVTGTLVRGPDGEPVFGIAVVQNITERRRIEQALRDSEQHMRLITDALPVYMLHCDTELRYRFVNHAYAARFELTPADLLGKRIPEIIGEQGLAGVKHHLDAVLSGSTVEYEALIDYPRLGSRYMRSVNVPEFDDEGNVRGMISVLTDITERKQMEEALRQSNQRKDEFLAMLAHELRNPLAPIRNATAVIKMLDAAREPQLQWAREVIERQSQHLSRLVDDLLDVSRITTGKIVLQKRSIELGTAITRGVEITRPAIEERGHRLSVSVPPDPIYLDADLTRLTQVLGNLLSNAVKYTDPGGQIWLSAVCRDDEVELKVRDSGIGIAEAVLPHVFELFTQAERTLDRAQGGLGIGLTLVHRLVQMHGGRVTASSPGFGQGSEFTVYLPVASAPSGSPDVAARARLRALRSHRVLIVDDNVDGARTLAMLFESYHNEVRVAYDGPSAVTTALSFQPDLVLLDIGLPGMDGYAVARTLRESASTRDTILVALTGYGQPEDRQRSALAGFDQHLVKPVEPEVLEALLRSISARSEHEAERMVRRSMRTASCPNREM